MSFQLSRNVHSSQDLLYSHRRPVRKYLISAAVLDFNDAVVLMTDAVLTATGAAGIIFRQTIDGG